MTCEIQWLTLGGTGGVLLGLALRTRRREPSGTDVPDLLHDRTRVTILCGLPFLIRLLQVGSPDFLPKTCPPMTLPIASWSIWYLSLILLALPVLYALGADPERRKPWLLPFGLTAGVLVMWGGLASSPFDQSRFDQALAGHEAFCKGRLPEIPDSFPDLRDTSRRMLENELRVARETGSSLFASRGAPPVESMLLERRGAVERQASDLARLLEQRERDERIAREQRRRMEEAASRYYPGYSGY